MKLFRVLSLVVVLSFIHCSEETLPPVHLCDSSFYPVSVGLYWDYKVHAVDIKVLGNDTSDYYVRDVVTDSLIVSPSDVTYLLSRYVRSGLSDPWVQDSLWSIRKTDYHFVETRNNTPLVKLVFPIGDLSVWDGNLYNNMSAVMYSYEYEGLSELATVVDLDNLKLVRTLISDFDSPITGQDKRTEIFAQGIGLVEKSYRIINLCTVSEDCELGSIIGGWELEQVLIGYGVI